MLDRMSLLLFGTMPRECGNPYRHRVETTEQVERHILENNGIHDCFVSVYSSNFTIDKIFIDVDKGNYVLKDAKAVYKNIIDQGYPAVPVVSGMNGYHIYPILKPKRYGSETKLLLAKATYSIVQSVFGKFRVERIEKNGHRLLIIRNKDRIIGVDPKPIGDIRRLCRLPGTSRPPHNLSHCSYLPPDEFLDMTEEDISKYMKNPYFNGCDISYENAPTLHDFEYEFAEVDFREWIDLGAHRTESISKPNLFLETVLRPCLYHNIIKEHPDHDTRVAVSYDLLMAKYSPSFILSVFSTLGWEDWDDGYCFDQIKSCEKDIKEKHYNEYSCTKLRSLKIPTVCCVY